MNPVIDPTVRNRQDDLLFATFTRDLARRHRRPRLYPRAPSVSDVLEQLCGGAVAIPETLSVTDLEDASD